MMATVRFTKPSHARPSLVYVFLLGYLYLKAIASDQFLIIAILCYPENITLIDCEFI
jgi:hypothetical protein